MQDFQFDVELEPSCYFQTGPLVPDTSVLGRALQCNLMVLSLELGLSWLCDYRLLENDGYSRPPKITRYSVIILNKFLFISTLFNSQ